MRWTEAGGRILVAVPSREQPGRSWRISTILFWFRYVALTLLGVAVAVLPEAAGRRGELLLVVALVGLPYVFLVARWTRRTGRIPVGIVAFEGTMAAVVGAAFPLVWTPMLILTMGNLALHAVIFEKRAAFTSCFVSGAAFAVAGAVARPPEWTLAVVTLAVMAPTAPFILGTLAERERDARSRLGAMVEGVDAVLLEADPRTRRFTFVSHQAEELLGYPADDWLASPTFWTDHMHPDDVRRCVRTYEQAVGAGRDFELEFRMIAADGRIVWFHARVNVEVDAKGDAVHVRGVAVDVTERRRAEEALRHQALHDALTGLPNRILLQDRLRHAVATAQRGGEHLALLLMDVDQFKEINDTLGHEHGDRLLQQIGVRLQRVLRDHDTVARLGGDEFGLIVPAADRVGAEIVAGKIASALEQPFRLEDMTVQARASVGISLYPRHGEDAETLVQRADVAMYVAKRQGRGHSVYDPALDRFSLRRLALIADLRRALLAREFELHYQPKLDLRTDRVIGVESLLRWRHPEHGLMGPDRFIGLAEVAGLIQPITNWVLGRALRQCRAWLNAGLDLAVSANISARDLHDPELPDRVAELLDRWCVSPEHLVLEITEHEIMRDRAQATETLERLGRMGVRVSIDDFGTGYSSLADLRQLPIDEIKIDRSFVADMVTDVNDAVIVRSIVDLGHNLGINVVAEGVENAEIRSWLTELGCDELQGFDICHPLSARELETWIRAREELVSDRVPRSGKAPRPRDPVFADHLDLDDVASP